MTIESSSSHGSLSKFESISPEIPIIKKRAITVPLLDLKTGKQKTSLYQQTGNIHTERKALESMLHRQQYTDILNYLSSLSPDNKLKWLRENANYHVPLMFALIIEELTLEEDNDIEDIAYIIYFVELRIKQDLACWGYPEELQERVAYSIIDEHIHLIQKTLQAKIEGPIYKHEILYEIDRSRNIIPIALDNFSLKSYPPPIDWRVFYHVKIPFSTKKLNRTLKGVHQGVFEEYQLLIKILNTKQFFSVEQFTPRHDECTKESNCFLRISFSYSDLKSSNLLGLIFSRDEIDYKLIDNYKINRDNLHIATLLHVWSEKNEFTKKEWLTQNAYGKHPILLHELGISTFSLDPTLNGFKQAYEYILLGTLRVLLDVECTPEEILQEIPLTLKSLYIGKLLQIAKEKCSEFEVTKILLWEECGAAPTFNHQVINRFLEAYDDNRVSPDPEWIFTHSHDYDPHENNSYETMNGFAFPHWMWKRRRESLLNNLRTIRSRSHFEI